MEDWFLLDTGESSPEYNMALDEALLSFSLKNNIPILRFYKWNPPTLSIGYFQKAGAAVDFAELSKRGFGFVRRPTGGRAVLHDKEITYSICLPISHNLLELSIIDSYDLLCKPIVEAFNNLGISAYLSADNDTEVNSPSCFAAPTFKDIKVNGKKIVGSAQMRDKRGLLQHGSILINVNIEDIFSVLKTNGNKNKLINLSKRKITSLRDEGFKDSIEKLKEEIIKTFIDAFDINFKVIEPSEIGSFSEYILKYSSNEWNYRI
jgi:lipoate-protein ligase A